MMPSSPPRRRNRVALNARADPELRGEHGRPTGSGHFRQALVLARAWESARFRDRCCPIAAARNSSVGVDAVAALHRGCFVNRWSVRAGDDHFGMAIAVGTALPGGPPRRSQRALLTHWAPALGASGESRVGPGMNDAGGREPSCREAVHALPVQARALAAAPKRVIPVTDRLRPECVIASLLPGTA